MELDDAIKTRIRNEIIMSAKIKRTVNYSILELVGGLKDAEITDIEKYLHHISVEDFNKGMPILWATALPVGSQLPSEGFFDLIVELKIAASVNDDNRRQIHAKLVSAVYDYWSRRRKTGKRKY
jgi:hypothetical protein